MSSSKWAAVLLVLGAAACNSAQERANVLRAKKIELVGDDGKTKLDLESEVIELRERVAKLEARAASAPPASVPTADASTAPSAATGDGGPPHGGAAPARRPAKNDPGYGKDQNGGPGY